MKVEYFKCTKIKYTKNCTKVYDSYKLKNNNQIEKIAREIAYYRYINKLTYNRKSESYFNEIKAHNRLYKLHLFRNHTKDTDLEENIKKWKEILFKIIGR